MLQPAGEKMKLREMSGSCLRGYLGTKLTGALEGDMSTRQWSLGRGGSLRPGDAVGMCALVAPGPQNEIEELAKSWASREQGRRPRAGAHWVPGAADGVP